jgi:hypothetical protein
MAPAALYGAIQNSMLGAVLLALLTMVLRGRRRAAVVYLFFWAFAVAGGSVDTLLYRVAFFGVELTLLTRFGLLASAVHALPWLLLTTRAFNLDSGSPYALGSYVILGTFVALTALSFHTALGSRSVFAAVLNEERA